MINFKQIAQRLNNVSADYCKYLLPNGIKRGLSYLCGSVRGEKGKSLRICLSGEKTGLWADFAAGTKGGDLISLTAAVKNLSQKDAAKFCARYLNIDLGALDVDKITIYDKPDSSGFTKIKKDSDVYNYLTVQRNIEPLYIRYFYLTEENDKCLIFPFVKNDELISAKRKNINGGTSIFTGKNFKPTLFGWQQVDINHFKLDEKVIVITEGEIDCITLTQCGLLALSLPNGANALGWFDLESHLLERFEKIILCFDMDEAGGKGSKILSEKFSKAAYKNIHIAQLPHKDPNDCLKAGIKKEELKNIILDAKLVPGCLNVKDLARFSDFFDDIVAYDKLISERTFGISLPWDTNFFRWRPSEVSILTGVTGHGKTQFLNQVIIHTISSGDPVLMASPEMDKRKIGSNLIKLAVGGIKVPLETKKKVSDKLFNNLIFHTVEGEINLPRLLQSITKVMKTESVSLITIDNLSMCDVQSDNKGLNQQRKAINLLVAFAKKHNKHIILVAHPRKLKDTNIPAGQYDVSGSAALVNIANNVFCFWRNEKKEKIITKSKYNNELLTEDEWKKLEEPDAILICHKNRFDGKKFSLGFWFDVQSGQFLLKDKKPIRYISHLTKA